MNKNIYEKTRYQCIKRHKINKNYVIDISKPYKTSISKDEDGNKIYDIDKAIKIRDNPTIKVKKKIEKENKSDFDELWDKYIYACQYVKKLSYNTIKRKNKDYNCHLKGKIKINIHRCDMDFWSKFIDELNTTNKQKNHIMKQLRAFYNWMKDNKLVADNPFEEIAKYKIENKEMKYWTQDEVKRFFEKIEELITSEDIDIRKDAYLIETFVLFGFALGARVGEIRALTWNSIDFENKKLLINHSIEYDPSKFKVQEYIVKKGDTLYSIANKFRITYDELIYKNRFNKDYIVKEKQKILIPASYVKSTKNEWSSDYVDLSEKHCKEIKEYKDFLINDLKLDLNPMIFWNYNYNKPYSDVALRKKFHKFCRMAKVTEIRMYDLRHTFVATMMTEGMELYHIQRFVRHKVYNTTVNKYGHLSQVIKNKAINITDNYF